MVKSAPLAAAACSIASTLAPAKAFVDPGGVSGGGATLSPRLPTAVPLYQEDGAPFPPGRGGGPPPPTNATAALDAGARTGIGGGDGDDGEDFVGAGSLGDIMATEHPRAGAATAVVDGLVTRDGGELNARFPGGNFSPMERIALTANGNLQRIFSSYYDAPVRVHVDFCARRTVSSVDGEGRISLLGVGLGGVDYSPLGKNSLEGDAVWDRVVSIQVHDVTICRATSIISVKTPECIRLIDEGLVGLGQLFRHLNKLPTFSLLDAGRTEPDRSEFQGGMWRTYELDCEEMRCLIHEEFLRDAWDVLPP